MAYGVRAEPDGRCGRRLSLVAARAEYIAAADSAGLVSGFAGDHDQRGFLFPANGEELCRYRLSGLLWACFSTQRDKEARDQRLWKARKWLLPLRPFDSLSLCPFV